MWQVTDKLHHKKCCIEYTPPWTELELNTLLVIGSDCTCNCKPSYHTIMTTTVPSVIERIRWYVMNEERTGSWLQQTEHIRGHLWRHERRENRIVTTTNITYPWSSVTSWTRREQDRDYNKQNISVVICDVMNEERTGSWLQQTEHIRGHLWRHERGENRIVTTANRTYPWSSVTQTFRNCWPSHVIMVVD
jgi:hypothetical protein